jgi:hypothetical protein
LTLLPQKLSELVRSEERSQQSESVMEAQARQLVHQYPVSNGRPAPQFATGGYGENGDAADVFSPWVFGGVADPGYTNNVTYVDGSVQALHRRERPKLLFTADGRTFLYNAAQSPLNASRDFSFTLVQEVLAMPA